MRLPDADGLTYWIEKKYTSIALVIIFAISPGSVDVASDNKVFSLLNGDISDWFLSNFN